ncbi:alpha/beta fold hydrolase [Phaeobacter sp. HF9A]|uniref:alpha/beta fold hydrolase n=1 Tax=Phaeobacter sp. HF9A TaxID=2721561 RepID=UPI0014311E2F|nr:alpha/beta hydrolase [Phaeobacter sp. HF9A]NIZ14896.1 alpha/beta hydrolase [Phaeobacter sp. HF9A]
MSAAPSLTLAYEAAPDTGLPPLLLVHGLLVSRDIWAPNAALAHHFRLIRVDLPGHGQSPMPQAPEQTRPDAIVAALDRLRRSLGIAKWHVCGQSFGAGIVLRYALDHPEACMGVVFTNANGALREVETEAQLEARRSLVADLRAGGQSALRKLPYHPANARRFPPELRDILSERADATNPEDLARLMQEALPRLSVRERLDRMSAPTLLINGVYEKKFQPTRDWLRETHPGIAITDLPGGHSVNVECPTAFDTAVVTFLDH